MAWLSTWLGRNSKPARKPRWTRLAHLQFEDRIVPAFVGPRLEYDSRVTDATTVRPGQIQFISISPHPDTVRFDTPDSNVSAADTTNTDQAWLNGGLGLNLTGTGTTVGVWEAGGGRIRNTHQEFGGRASDGDSGGTLSDHATHVAGTIAASGVSPTARGMASAVSIRGFTSADDTAEMSANSGSLVATNHSYGFAAGWNFDLASNYGLPVGLGSQWIWLNDRSVFSQEDLEFGRYGPDAVAVDAVLAANPNLLSLFSAGNDRNDAPTGGTTQYVTYFSSDPGNVSGWAGPGWYLAPNSGPTVFPGSDGNNGTGYDTITGERAIKNGIIVGAINRSDADPLRAANVVMSAFSSWGPTDDGRVAPTLVAAGVDLNSSLSTADSDYGLLSGTSMATPNATGTAALLREFYIQTFGTVPSSATLRGLMTHTAFDAGTLGPDYVYGFGVLDAAAAVNLIRQAKAGTATLNTGSYTGTPTSTTFTAKGGVPLKATIVWTDPAGTAQTGLDNPTPVLVNDLDIYAVGPGGTVHQAWRLNPASPSAAATRASGASFNSALGNRVDNIEQVLIDAPTAGVYTIHIRHEGAAFNQAYTVLVSEGGDRFERNESLATAAKVGVAPGINIANLSIHSSTDNDWYRFEVLRPDSLRVKATFPVAAGNLDLQVTNSIGTVLANGTVNADNETLDVNGLAPGTYYVRVFGAAGATNAYELSITPAPTSTTVVYYVNDSRADDGVYSFAAGSDANDGLTPQTPKATVEAIVGTYDLGSTSLVAIDTGTYATGTVTITAADEGGIFAGSPFGSNFGFGGNRFDLVDADFNILHGLSFTGGGGIGVYLHPGAVDDSSSNRLIQNTFSGTSTGIRLERGGNNSFESNTITSSGNYGIYVIDSAASTAITGNTIASRDAGIAISSSPTGTTITGNTVSNSNSYAIYSYSTSGTAITNNTLTGSGRGLYMQYNTGATVIGNTAKNNTVGFEGDAVFGGTSWAAGQSNDLDGNTTGILLYGGATSRFNRIHHNSIGVSTSDSAKVTNNVIYRNTQQGVLIDGDNTVSVLANTIYAPLGDAVRLRNFSQNVTLKNNILHVESGYALSVTNDSQFGLVSDYNNLYSTGAGRPVSFQKEFADLFDWQVESGYDAHSIGRTAPAPTLDDPQYVNLAGDNYLLGVNSTSIDAGDPAALFSTEPAPNGGRVNLGAYGNTALATNSKASFLELNYPTYYTDWEFQESRPILWRGFNLTGNVSIDVVEEITNTVRHIADVPVSTGSFTWIPSTTPGLSASITARHRIRVTSAVTPSITVSSREAFSVTLGTTVDFYVNDAASGMDEYATAAGDNRKTGKTPGDPKSSLIALLRSYHLEPGDIVRIDAGSYNHVSNIVISGNLSIGDDEGATFQGATGSKGGSTILDRANAFNQSTNIELNDGDEVTLRNLILQGAYNGLWIRNNSIRFDGTSLTTRNNAQAGLIVESDSAESVVDQLISHDNGGNGMTINAPIGSLLNSQTYNNGGHGIILSGALTAVRNIQTHHNAGTGLILNGSGNAVVELVEAYSNNIGIDISNGSGSTTVVGNANLALGKGNRVHDNVIGISAGGSGVHVVGNAVTNNTTGVYVGGSTIERNVISGGATGVYVYAGATILRNRIYNNTLFGVQTYYGVTLLENTIYSGGGGGISTYYSGNTIRNNLIYGHANYGIQNNQGSAEITNNTVYQTSGDGVQLISSSNNVSLNNNILWTTAGAAISVASDSQTGLVSDYNLLRATGAGSVGRWQNVLRANLNAWQNAAFTDQNTISQDPLFVDFDGADNVLGYQSAAIDGRDDNFHVASDSASGSFPGSIKNGSLVPVLVGGLPVMLVGTWSVDGARSPTIDRGNAASPFANEPAPNGGYADLGAYGNTEQTSRSPVQYLLATRPDGGEVWPAAQTFAVRWRADNFGGGNALDFDGVDDYAAMPHSSSLAFGNGASITLEAWINPDNFNTYGQTLIAKGRTGGNESANYVLRLGNGNYTDRHLVFYYRSTGGSFNTFTSTAQFGAPGVWQHVAASYTFGTAASMKLYVNGVEVPGTWTESTGNETPVSTTDPLWLGAINGADAAASEQQYAGLLDDVRIWNVIRTPAQIAGNMNNFLTGGEPGLAAYWKLDETSGTVLTDSTANANHGALAAAPAQPVRAASTAPLSRVDLDLVTGAGAFVSTITSATPNDGEYLWSILESVVPSTDYKVRVRRTDTPAIVDTSNAPFEITEKISFYYVNDDSFADGSDLTSAVGDDGNNGLSAATPKASVRSVLETYDLGPGDVILVDGGSYDVGINILVTSNDTGVTIRGNPNNHPTLSRGNTASGAATFEISGADDVTIENMTLTAGYYGVWVPLNDDTDDLTLRRLKLVGNSNTGLYVDSGNTGVRFEDGLVSGSIRGILLYRNPDGRIVNSDVFDNSSSGIEIDGYQIPEADRPTVEGSRIRDNNAGIYITHEAAATSNLVWNNDTYGIYIQGSGSQVTGNRVWAQSKGTGIYVYAAPNSTLIENNDVFSNSVGLETPYSNATTRDNSIYDNGTGIRFVYSSLPLIGNAIYSNGIGIQTLYGSDSTFAVENNLIYANSVAGVSVEASNQRFLNNTVYQPAGNAFQFISGPGATLRNNIIQVGAGKGLFVDAASVSGLTADYDLIRTTGSGVASVWEGVTFIDRAELSYETGQERNGLVGDAKFVDVDGIDGVLGYSLAPAAAGIVQGDAAASLAGTWDSDPNGLGGSQRTTASSSNPAQYRSATWTFSGLELNATYEVALSWSASPSWSHDSHFAVKDSLGANSLSAVVNQQIAPADFSADGAMWKRLGRIVALGGSYSVVLDNFSQATSSPVVADGVRLVKIVADAGGDDKFGLQSGSPGIDAGDLTSAYSLEPAPNGGRINLGHTGNTADATASPASLIQVLAPTDIGKVEVGATAPLVWRNFGLPTVPVPPGVNAAYDANPLAYYRLGEALGPIAGDSTASNLSGVYQNGVTLGGTGINGSDAAASFDGVDDSVSLPSGFSDFTGGLSFSVWVNPSAADAYDAFIDLGNGNYLNRIILGRYNTADSLRFHLGGNETAVYTTIPNDAWTHVAVTMDTDKLVRIYKNGTQVHSQTFPLMPTDVLRNQNFLGRAPDGYYVSGKLDEAAFYNRAITPAEVTAMATPANYGAFSRFGSVKLDLLQNGAFVQAIPTPGATHLNTGGYAWSVPAGLPTGTGYQVRVSTLDNVTQGLSASFRVVPSGNQFYVATTGDNTNSGRSPAEPMRTVRALVNAYDLDPGDVVNVAAGSYRHVTNVILTAEDSGVTIVGPTVAAGAVPAVTIDRGNTTTGNAVFQLSGADDVTINDLTATGARDGVWVPANAGSDRLTLHRVRLADNSRFGLYAEPGNTEVRFEDGVVTRSTTGIYLFRVPDSVVLNSDVFDHSSTGVFLDGNTLAAADRPRIENSRVRDADTGVYLSDGATAVNNSIWNNLTYGLFTYSGSPQMTGNRVWGQTKGTGIYSLYSDAAALIENNDVFSNSVGMLAYYSSIAMRGNRVFANSAIGIQSSSNSSPILGNTIHSNSTGILLDGGADTVHTIESNLIYGNSNYGIRVQGTNRRLLANTIYQPVGDALRFESGSGASVRNNILHVDAGAALSVDHASVSGLTSNYNHFATTGAGTISLWEDIPFTNRAEFSYETSQDVNSGVGSVMFTDPDGADNVLGYSIATVAGTQIVRDDPAATLSGVWTTDGNGLNGSQRVTASSSDPLQRRSATWAFTGLEANATYEVAVTWKASASWSYRSQFFVRDSLGANSLNVLVDQQTAPSDFTADGASWRRLGRVVSLGSTLNVVLDNEGESYFGSVVADGVRLVKVIANAAADDKFTVQSGSPTVDAGDPSRAFSLEPAPNGGRSNIGHTGNTAAATTSPTRLIQVLAPTDIGKVEVGAASNLAWRSFGLPSATVPPGTNAVYDTTPLAYYRLGEAAGTFAADLSGNNLHGEYVNGVGLGASGINAADSAASFDGLNDRVSLASGFSDFTGGISLSVWVNPNLTGGGDYQSFIDLGDGVEANRITFSRYSPDSVRFYIGGSQVISGVSLQNNVWQHFAATMGADKVARIYKNGVQIASQTLPNLPTNVLRTRNSIGAQQETSSYHFPGKLDEAAIYNRALTPAEVTSLANAAGYGLFSTSVNVKLDLFHDGIFKQSISGGSLNTGAFTWSVPAGLATDDGYQIRVSTLDNVTQGTSAAFRVVPTGNQFYVSTTGDNANSGRTVNEPMRTARALVNAYDLDAGDVVNVAAGTYRHVTNVILGASDSGVTITGPAVAPGALPTVTINRGNTTSNNAVFEASGGDDVLIQDITATGGRDGVLVTTGGGTDRLTLRRMRLAGNTGTGLNLATGSSFVTFEGGVVTGNSTGIYHYRSSDFAVVDSEIFNNSSHGLDLEGGTLLGASLPRIEGSNIHHNGTYGIQVQYGAVIADNDIHHNSADGILAYYDGAQIHGNRVHHHAGNSGIYSLYGSPATLIADNEVFLNGTGLEIGSSSATVRDNRVYGNTGTGIYSNTSAPIQRNFVYSNSIGIDIAGGDGTHPVENNLVYANTNIGIRVTGSGRRLTNNTAYQPVGDALRLDNAPNITLRNNITWSDAGYGVYVDTASKTGFNSDANLFHQGAGGSAFLGFWGGDIIDTLAAWKTATGGDAASKEGNPLFVDRDGADNVLGYVTTGGGFDGGPDDNFVPAAASPVIDAADLFTAPLTDITGGGRSDDPATPNAGRDYAETNLGSSGFTATGIGQNWQSTNNAWNLNLPFSFPFYDATYTTVRVSSEGYLYFSGPMGEYNPNNSTALLAQNRIIAPLWDDLRTDESGDDIFIDNGTADQTTIRWNATHQTTFGDVNFSVTLFKTGEIRFHYGSGNTGLTPTVGISRGDSVFLVESALSNLAVLTNAASRKYIATPSASGIADIGAYEFRGNSLDTLPPTIIGSNPAGIHASSSVFTRTTSITLTTSEPLNPVSALAVAAYKLYAPGGDLMFDTGDDVIYSLTPSYVSASTAITLTINSPDALAPGLYRLRAGDIYDLAGNNLDGDANTVGGDPYIRTFTVASPGITVTPTMLTTSETGTSAQFSVVLVTQPASDVTIALGNGDATEGLLSQSSLVFTNANWNIPQIVSVMGQDDVVQDGDVIYTVTTAAAVSADPRYSGLNAADVTVTNTDDENTTPVVTDFVVNDGVMQRSRLTKIVVNFASPVSAAFFQVAGAVKLTRTHATASGIVGTVVDINSGLLVGGPATGQVSSITLTFAHIETAGVEYGSLADGRWQLEVLPASFTSGAGDTELRRLFGDIDNNGTVDGPTDFAQFGGVFGTTQGVGVSPFDWNNDGQIDGAVDFARFGGRFGVTL